MILRPRTIALDTNFLIGIRDRAPEYAPLQERLRDRVLLPVVNRAQMYEMALKGNATVANAMALLRGCDAPVFELPPWHYVMEAEVYAEATGKKLTREGLIGRTQAKALDNLLRMLPPKDLPSSRPPDVTEDSLVESAQSLSVSAVQAQFETWKGRMGVEDTFTEVERSDRANKADLLERYCNFRDARAHNLYDLPSLDKLRDLVDVARCPCLLTYWNNSLLLGRALGYTVTMNDFIDSIRLLEAPYVDIFSCDRAVRERLNQARVMTAGSVACSCVQEVLAAAGDSTPNTGRQ